MNFERRLARLENIAQINRQSVMTKERQIELFGCAFEEMSKERIKEIMEILESNMDPETLKAVKSGKYRVEKK